MTIDWIPSDPRVLALEDDLRDVFSIHEVVVRSRDPLDVVFAGQFLRSPDLVYQHLEPRFAELGMLALLRHEKGRDLVIASTAPPARGPRRLRINVILFLLTVLSVMMAGVAMSLPAAAEARLAAAEGIGETLATLFTVFLQNWTLGIPFTVALLGILGVHEFGHYFVARRYRLDVSLPYFIPFPNMLTGTMGAVIRIESPFASRKALYDVGIAGPLAGLAVALPVVILGLRGAEIVPLDLAPGQCVMIFGEPLLFQGLAYLLAGPRPPGTDLAMSPLVMAGWWGLLVTALNLLPISQLDGGHISYAIFGRFHRVVAWTVYILAVLLALTRSPGYLPLLLLVLLMRIDHPPALNDLTPVGPGRRVLGILTLLSLFVLATPSPLRQECATGMPMRDAQRWAAVGTAVSLDSLGAEPGQAAPAGYAAYAADAAYADSAASPSLASWSAPSAASSASRPSIRSAAISSSVRASSRWTMGLSAFWRPSVRSQVRSSSARSTGIEGSSRSSSAAGLVNTAMRSIGSSSQEASRATRASRSSSR